MNTNRLYGTIPESIGNLSVLTYLSLYSNGLTGTIPNSIGNLSSLINLDLHSNKLTGTIPNSIGNLSLLISLQLHSNRLYGDIIDILWGLMRFTKILVISISGNNDICGDLSKLVKSGTNLLQNSLQYFMAYDCDLWGTLPNNIHFTQMKQLIIYNNRLSGNIPSKLITNELNAINTSILLPSNLFQIINNIPKWFKSPFISATSLYIGLFDKIKSLILAISLMVLLILFCMHNIYKLYQITHKIDKIPKQHKRKSADADREAMDSFISNIWILLKYFDGNVVGIYENTDNPRGIIPDIVLMIFNIGLMPLITILLTILYFFSSKYFQYSPIINQISLSYYYTNIDDNNKWIDWILIILIILLYSIICNNLLKSQQEQLKQSKSSLIQKPYDIINNKQLDNINHDDSVSSVIIILLLFIFYLCLFIYATISVILSV
eukprot:482905_1